MKTTVAPRRRARVKAAKVKKTQVVEKPAAKEARRSETLTDQTELMLEALLLETEDALGRIDQIRMSLVGSDGSDLESSDIAEAVETLSKGTGGGSLQQKLLLVKTSINIAFTAINAKLKDIQNAI